MELQYCTPAQQDEKLWARREKVRNQNLRVNFSNDAKGLGDAIFEERGVHFKDKKDRQIKAEHNIFECSLKLCLYIFPDS